MASRCASRMTRTGDGGASGRAVQSGVETTALQVRGSDAERRVGDAALLRSMKGRLGDPSLPSEPFILHGPRSAGASDFNAEALSRSGKKPDLLIGKIRLAVNSFVRVLGRRVGPRRPKRCRDHRTPWRKRDCRARRTGLAMTNKVGRASSRRRPRFAISRLTAWSYVESATVPLIAIRVRNAS